MIQFGEYAPKFATRLDESVDAFYTCTYIRERYKIIVHIFHTLSLLGFPTSVQFSKLVSIESLPTSQFREFDVS